MSCEFQPCKVCAGFGFADDCQCDNCGGTGKVWIDPEDEEND